MSIVWCDRVLFGQVTLN